MKDFNRFDDINHYPLRIYNRCVFLSNIMEDSGKAYAEDYIGQFSAVDRKSMLSMFNLIKKIGVRNTQKFVTDGLEFIDLEEVVNAQ